MEKSFTAQLGAGEQGPRRASSRPRRMNCSAVTSTWLCAAPRVPLRGPDQTAHKGPGDQGGMEKRGSDPKLHLPGSHPSSPPPRPKLLWGTRLSSTQASRLQTVGVLNAPSLSHHTSQAASPAPKPGDSASFLSASPPPAHLVRAQSLSISPWTPTVVSCPSNCRPLHRLCPLPGAPTSSLQARPLQQATKEGHWKAQAPDTVCLDSVDFTCVNMDNNGNSLPLLQDPLSLLCGFSTAHITVRCAKCSFSLPVPTPSIILATTRAQVPSRRAFSLLDPQGLA